MFRHYLRTSHPGAVLAVLGAAIALPMWLLDAGEKGGPLLFVAKWMPLLLIALGLFSLVTRRNKWNLPCSCPGCGWQGTLKALRPLPGNAFACPQCDDVLGADGAGKGNA